MEYDITLDDYLDVFEDSSLVNLTKRLTEQLVFIETNIRVATLSKTSNEFLNIEERFSVNKASSRSHSESLTLTESVSKTSSSKTSSETLTPNETITLQKVKSLSGSDQLLFNETPSRSGTISRTFSEQLNFQNGYTRKFNSFEVSYPSASLIKKENLFLLKGFNRVITLPNPNFDDSEANSSQLTIYRSVTNQIRTFVKQQSLKQLNYTFTISRNKSIELRNFIDNEKTNQIQIQNHKTELFAGFLLTNPVIFTTSRRGSPCGELVEVELQFEAVKVA